MRYLGTGTSGNGKRMPAKPEPADTPEPSTAIEGAELAEEESRPGATDGGMVTP